MITKLAIEFNNLFSDGIETAFAIKKLINGQIFSTSFVKSKNKGKIDIYECMIDSKKSINIKNLVSKLNEGNLGAKYKIKKMK